MGLPWIRLDSSIFNHDKTLSLLNDPSKKRHQAAFSYVCSLAWSGAHGTDGRIPEYALPVIHGDSDTARLLVKHRLWVEATAAWIIPNYADRQEIALVSEAKRERRHVTALRMNCVRHHGPECHCWKSKAP